MSRVKEMAQEYNSLASNGAAETRKQRIDIRLSASSKQLLEAEAAFRGQTLSAYLVSVALDNAVNSMEKRRFLELCNEDSQAFFSAMDKPEPPNAPLKEASRFYTRHVKSDA